MNPVSEPVGLLMRIDTATPFPYEFDVAKTALVLIDMQRDFIEPGGFGETLGNDVSLLEAIVPATQRALRAWREAGGLVVHTREAHRPDLRDCPPGRSFRPVVAERAEFLVGFVGADLAVGLLDLFFDLGQEWVGDPAPERGFGDGPAGVAGRDVSGNSVV